MDKADMKIAVILPAAGQSRRFAAAGGDKPKLDMTLGHKPVVMRSIELFTRRSNVTQIIIAVDPDGVETFKFKYGDKLGLLGVKVVPGGKRERWETIKNALAAVDPDVTHIAVHDAARPITSEAVIDRVIEAATEFDAVIPASPVSATVRRIESEPAQTATAADDPLDAILGDAGKSTVKAFTACETVSRKNLVLIETPQLFAAALLRRAYAQIETGDVDTADITDDGGLVEALGETLHIVDGDPLNLKITRPVDLVIAEAVLQATDPDAARDPFAQKRRHKTWAEKDDD